MEAAAADSFVVVLASVAGYEVHNSVPHGAWERIPITIKLAPTKWFKGVEPNTTNRVAATEVWLQHFVYTRNDGGPNQLEAFGKRLDELIESNASKVWFLTAIDQHLIEHAQPDVHLEICDGSFIEATLAADQKNVIPSIELGLRCHTTDEEFHAAIELVCKEDLQFVQKFDCWDPVKNSGNIDDAGLGDTNAFVTVLGGPRLEKLLLAMIREPEQFVADRDGRIESADDPYFLMGLTRCAGFSLLSNFRSQKNIQLAESFLADESWWIRAQHSTLGVSYDKEYYASDAAMRVLKIWGEPVEQDKEFKSQVVELSKVNDSMKRKVAHTVYPAGYLLSEGSYFVLPESPQSPHPPEKQK